MFSFIGCAIASVPWFFTALGIGFLCSEGTLVDFPFFLYFPFFFLSFSFDFLMGVLNRLIGWAVDVW